MNPFANRDPSPAGPATDILPVTPDDAADLPIVASALYVETGGTLAIVTLRGEARSVAMGDRAILPVVTRRVLAAGTTATGIHALVTA